MEVTFEDENLLWIVFFLLRTGKLHSYLVAIRKGVLFILIQMFFYIIMSFPGWMFFRVPQGRDSYLNI